MKCICCRRIEEFENAQINKKQTSNFRRLSNAHYNYQPNIDDAGCVGIVSDEIAACSQIILKLKTALSFSLILPKCQENIR